MKMVINADRCLEDAVTGQRPKSLDKYIGMVNGSLEAMRHASAARCVFLPRGETLKKRYLRQRWGPPREMPKRSSCSERRRVPPDIVSDGFGVSHVSPTSFCNAPQWTQVSEGPSWDILIRLWKDGQPIFPCSVQNLPGRIFVFSQKGQWSSSFNKCVGRREAAQALAAARYWRSEAGQSSMLLPFSCRDVAEQVQPFSRASACWLGSASCQISCGHRRSSFSAAVGSQIFIVSAAKMTIVSESKRSNERTANATTSTAKNEFSCPACPTVLTTAHELTNHILSHNSSANSDCSEDEYTCGVCHKVLSSASSLTRHVYVHSGEKPFKCKYCEMAFSTNGNMNRHHRTAHREMRDWPSMSCTDSDSSDDSNKPASRRQADEYNNNEVRKSISPQIAEDYTKRKHSDDEDDDTSTRKKSRMVLKDSKPRAKARLPKTNSNLACPVCEDLVFEANEQLDDHLKTYHSTYVIKCDMCDRIFNSNRMLSVHKFMEHYGNGRGAIETSVEGFNDLTFVDFSSDKFPAIARAMCEQSLHRPASVPAFECPKCARGFPCKQALDSHKLDCGNQLAAPPADIKTADHSKRNDFFAGLNLQNRAAAVEAREGKDLADIQSIISTASEPIFPRSDRSTPDQQIKLNPNVGSSGSSGGASEYQEETQDAFAVEFRKMKLKGEFPCRLCDSKFQNLRALKGHNRQHLNVPSGMPFPCSMCPYQHPERGALMKHLRDHNGDRPYECSICNYAFTTKANCERHVRNRHGKQTREEIKSVLIYHPSEDITNEGVDRGTSPRRITRDDARRTIIYPEDMPSSQLPFIEPNDLSLPDEGARMRHRSLPTLINPPISHYDHTGMFSRPVRAQEIPPRTDAPDEDDSKSSDGSVSLVSERQTELHQRLHSPVNLQRVEATNDSPLDLSMDVLDLSKKSRPAEEERKPAPRLAEENASAEVIEAAQRLLLAQAIIAEGAQGRLGSIYNNAPLMYSSVAAFPGAPSAIQPYLYNSPLFNPNLAARRDRARDLALHLTSGGSMIEPTIASSNFPAAYPQQIPARARNDHAESFSNTVAHLHNSTTSERGSRPPSSSNSSVKMVIKNGVLMPKQKQRRYRTEKPYVCEICDAKFTLRSNMERHIKHQHPKRWSQRPRGGHSTRGRPPANPASLVQNSSMQPNHQMNFSQFDQVENDKPVISAEVKNAILAQHLKGTKRENESEDEGLIIDEAAGDKASPVSVKLQPTTSLLRGKLEEHVNFDIEKKYDNVPQDFSKMEIRVKTEPEASEDEEDTGEKLEKKIAVNVKQEDNGADLASVSELLDNASQQYQQFRPQYISDEEGLVASTSDCNISGSDDKSDSMTFGNSGDSSIAGKWKKKKMTKKKKKKMSAYSMAPNKVLCTYCERTFPWQSSLRRHILTHTGHKPFQCAFCGLLFTTKSNCDRHLMRKHRTSLGRCRMKHSSSPEATNTDSNKFAMRNVPERPYKCNRCPSSTFSTIGNLKKHRSAKHSGNRSRPESPVSDTNSEQQENSTVASKQREDNSGEDSQSSVSEPADNSAVADLSSKNNSTITPPAEAPRSRRPSPRSSPGPADGPFKCHLCDCGFAERQDCLDHIKESHVKAYELLMNKGALDMDTENVDEHPTQPSDPEERRGKFPDYSNRKVVCAFCMRRFWSAEDLRRHMRTHTGERPYSCDICSRRFTLKHSMLRHRKKHESVDSTMYVGTSGDEETVPAQLSNATRSQQQAAAVAVAAAAAVFNATTTGGDSRGQERMSLPTVATVATGDAAPSGLMRYNPYENLASFAGRLNNTNNYVSDATAADGDSDLISNLLGIGDRNIIEQVLHGSPDDAAKILGVNRSHD